MPKHKKRAQKWLGAFAILATGGGLLLSAMIASSPSPEAKSAASTALICCLGGGAFYFVMWLWSHSNIVAAASLSIAVCVLDMLVSFLASPAAAGLGLVLKVFFISAMAKAISVADEEH